MEKVIGLTEARSTLSTIVNDVQYEQDTYIISRQGKPAVAVVPLEILERYQEERRKLFAVIDEVQAQNEEADPDELMQIILQAQQAVRGESTFLTHRQPNP